MNYFLHPQNIMQSGFGDSRPPFLYLLDGKSAYIKSKLLNSAALSAEEEGLLADRFLSKYDYDKLSAVFLPKKNVLIADSIYFNKLNEDYTKKVINTDIFFSREENEETQKKYFSILESIKSHISDAAKFENAAKNLCMENKKIIAPYISRAKILNYIFRFISRNSLSQNETKGKNSTRHISETTPWGIHTCYETVMQCAKSVVVIHDEYKHISSLLISGLCEAFNQCGYDTTTLNCSICHNCSEHLLIPALSLAFFTENRNHQYPFNDTGEIATRRFLKSEPSAAEKSAIHWNNEMADDFLDESVFALFEAMEKENEISDALFRSFDEKLFLTEKDKLAENILK